MSTLPSSRNIGQAKFENAENSQQTALKGCEHIAHLNICGRNIRQAKSENAENSQ
jgi:hypothetical protein